MLTHKQKVKLARKLRTREDILLRRPIFLTPGWEAHREGVHARHSRRQFEAHQRAIKRRKKVLDVA